jgi:hypothetical protein
MVQGKLPPMESLSGGAAVVVLRQKAAVGMHIRCAQGPAEISLSGAGSLRSLSSPGVFEG